MPGISHSVLKLLRKPLQETSKAPQKSRRKFSHVHALYQSLVHALALHDGVTSFVQVNLGVYLDISANKLNFSQHRHLHIHGLAMSVRGFFYCSPYEKYV